MDRRRMRDLDKVLTEIAAIRGRIVGSVVSRRRPGAAAAADLAGASR
jgi:hypothetical protein